MLPDLEVGRFKNRWAWIAGRLLSTGAVAVALMVLIANPFAEPAGRWALGITLAVLAITRTAAVEVVARSQVREQRELRTSAPAGTLFAARATAAQAQGTARPVLPRRRDPRGAGLLRLDADGVRYWNSPERPAGPDQRCRWSEARTVRLTPRTPLFADLELDLADDTRFAWVVPSPEELGSTLQRIWADEPRDPAERSG